LVAVSDTMTAELPLKATLVAPERFWPVIVTAANPDAASPVWARSSRKSLPRLRLLVTLASTQRRRD
jgi:hypothetical protein